MSLIRFISCFALITLLAEARPGSVRFFGDKKGSCGYESCHATASGVLNVHLVPHSHDDVGWLKTLDQYYYGSRTSTQRAGVQYILDSVIDELLKDPIRRFVYVESAFFEKWWLEQTEERRENVKQLVSEGRLEFAGGAWSMNDEAGVHYHSVVDQLTWGLRLLNDTFGECGRPKVGWQIDPFGHGRELTNIWAQAGFDGLFLGRIDHQDKKKREENKEAEMIWRGSDDLGDSSDLFTGVLFNRYSPPPGFCFDILCSDDPVIDDPNSPDYNVDRMVERFLSYVESQSKTYKTNNIILTMGDDFFYQDASIWYKNLDKLIKYVNRHQNVTKLIYSTPSCYLKSLYESNTTWPTKQDDFFPYSSDVHAFWTGYFTSRPTIKYYERKGNNILQICKQLQAMTDPSDESGLRSLRAAMGVMQHHDAITGTEKEHVARDYSRILEAGIQDCLKVSEKALNSMISPDSNLAMKLCKLNMTECEVSENLNQFVITVYNPIGQDVDEFVRFPFVGVGSYSIKDNSGKTVDYHIVPISEGIKEQLKTRNSSSTHEIVFKAEAIPGLGFRSYYVSKTASNDIQTNSKAEETIKYSNYEDIEVIENEYIKVSFDTNSGLISKVSLSENNETIDVEVRQEFLFYEGWSGNNNATNNRASGAYVFRPKSVDALPITDHVNITLISKNPLVQEVHQRFSNWASQIVRVYRGQKHVELEWLIGPIPIDDNIGKEVVSRISTDFNTDDTFFTDSNGRQLIKRILNKRPTWDVQLEEPISGNYYPVTSMLSIKDVTSKRELAFLTDRAQGGSSLKNGQVELMIHRRLLHDDAFGVGEALNETIDGIGLVARGSHYLSFGKSDSTTPSIVQSRRLAITKLLQPLPLFSPANIDYNQWINNNNLFKGVSELPENVHILTLEPWSKGSILLRLEHYLQRTDDPENLSKSVTFDIESLFVGISIKSIKEVTLAANQWKNKAERLRWESGRDMNDSFNDIYHKNCMFSDHSTDSCFIKSKLLFTHDMSKKSSLNQIYVTDNNEANKRIDVTLGPMEIKTFIIESV